VRLLKLTNLAVAFLLELVLLGVVAWWGFSVDGPTALRGLFGLGLPVLIAALWATVLAPTASRRLPMPWLVIVKLVLYALASAGLVAIAHPVLGLLLIATAAVSLGLAVLWRQEEVVTGPAATRTAGPSR
jgi:hypothetical protein